MACFKCNSTVAFQRTNFALEKLFSIRFEYYAGQAYLGFDIVNIIGEDGCKKNDYSLLPYL
jgi:hypothetical protein